ncbi:hypothetical protein GKC30_11655 [Pseudodesulfovibrio sp. F-1]|uniref:Restriction endonuclease type IV Mrr domain-containing protein n=1 Tax=Pseudodesulfovibrio alkaliphilus TaxID=2661613 RepID=A0A7K1KQP6_9BACT|nr:restriction endonuclease [Pseudodesulfovibrio alkaliphilus]MUM78290.1 hypothetical protein [Pseudodesulfovibrio alkaliphilus]
MPKTDFSKLKIKQILQHSLPIRFQDMDPLDFEDFIAYLFVKKGYEVQPTSYSGDYGADIIVSKNGTKIAVQVKRYHKKNKVDVKNVNQVIGAKSYYGCNSALIITTSDFTKPAHNLIKTTSTLWWSWNELQKNVSEVFLEGKDVFQTNIKTMCGSYALRISNIEYNQHMKRIGNCTLVFAELTNSGPNVNIAIGLPTYISNKNNQVEASYWYEGYFAGGMVYSGASIEIAFMFRSEQVPRVTIRDRFILPLRSGESDIEYIEASMPAGAIISKKRLFFKYLGWSLLFAFAYFFVKSAAR